MQTKAVFVCYYIGGKNCYAYSTCEVDSVNLLFKQNIKLKPVKVIENMRTMVCTSFTRKKKNKNAD